MTLDLSSVPAVPGVYLFKDRQERILYVGKAKSLKNRLKSYFQGSSKLDRRKGKMVSLIRDFSYIAVDNELEALILEANLIKRHKPAFNIILRDDKNYPYIKLTTAEPWPRIEVVRRIKKDGNLYFGPYVPSQAMWEAISVIRKNFPIRTCRYALERPLRPCVQHQMKRCSAPCAGLVSREDYLRIVEEVRMFLSGKMGDLVGRLQKEMLRLSDELRFEEAAELRDRISLLGKAFESQKVIAPELGDLDVIGLYCSTEGEDPGGVVSIMFVRNGILIGAKDFFFDRFMENGEARIMRSFIELFYTKEIIPPPLALVNKLPEDAQALCSLLSARRGEAVRIKTPVRGKKRELLQMASDNAALHYNSRKRHSNTDVLGELAGKLGLKTQPRSLGALDVSTIQGSESVGAFVFWRDGEFSKDGYRRFKIREVSGVDDYSMMREIVGRTFKKASDEGKEANPVSPPDLLVIDGGMGQLEAALGVLADRRVNIEVIGLAKKPDRAMLPDGRVIDLEDRSRASLLLKALRDEAHRFAVGFHRKLRDKRIMESPLEKIHGIGKKRRLELLRRFESLDAIRAATVEELATVKGFDLQMARRLKAGLNEL